jgi:hypothetical protein
LSHTVTQSIPATKRRKIPLRVTLAALMVLIFAAFNLLRFINTIGLWEPLQAAIPVSPYYLAVSGAVWAVVGAGLAIGLLLGADRARLAASLAAPAYTLAYWVDRVFLAIDPPAGGNFWFMIGVSFVLLVFFFLALWSARSSVYFRGANHEP